MSQAPSFVTFASQLQELSKREVLPYSNVRSLIRECTRAAYLTSTETSEKVGETVRDIFIAGRDIILKFGSTYTTVEQEELLEFTMHVVTILPNLPHHVLHDLEESMIKISRIAIGLFESHQNPEDLERLFLTLQTVNSGLVSINVRATPIVDTVDLFKRSMNLFVRNIERWNDETFLPLISVLKDAVANLGQGGGIIKHVMNHWSKLLADLQEKEFDTPQTPHRLMEITRYMVLGIVDSNIQLTPEGAAGLHIIFDLLDRIVITYIQKNPSEKQCALFTRLRESTLIGVSKVYPLFSIERAGRLGASTIPSSIVSPRGVAMCVGIGLEEAKLESVSSEQAFQYYIEIFSFIIRQSRFLTNQDNLRLLSGLNRCGEKIKPDSSLSRKRAQVWDMIVQEIQRLPSISFDSFQNLTDLICCNGLWIKKSVGFVEYDESLKLFEVVDAVSRAMARIPVTDKKRQEQLLLFQGGVANCMCSLRPTFAIEWFDRPSPPIPDCGRALFAAVRFLKEMTPVQVSSAYASDQFVRTFSFLMSHFTQVSEKRRLDLHVRIIDDLSPWKSDGEVVSGFIRAWTKELTSILQETHPPAQKSGSDKAKKGSKQPLSSPQNLAGMIDLLQEDLLGLVVSGKEIHEDAVAFLPPLLAAVEEATAVMGRDGSSERYSQTAFFVLATFGRVAPRVLIDRLNAIEPGKVSGSHIRKIEMMLSSCCRPSLLVDLQMRLFLLERIGAELEKYCYNAGLRCEPHPKGRIPLTVQPIEPERSFLHLKMEESLARGCLDVSCATYCYDYRIDPSQEMWVLFALRSYIRSFIEKERKAYASAYRNLDKGLPASDQTSSPFYNDALGPKPLAPAEIYSTAQMQLYDTFCSEPTSSLRHSPEELFGKVVETFDAFSQISYGWAGDLKRTFQPMWDCYERGVEAYERHTAQMAGYSPRFKVDRGPIRLLLLNHDDAALKAVMNSSFRPWIQEMLTGGEVGLARAVFASLVPGDAEFVTRMVRELELIDEEDVSSSDSETPSVEEMSVVQKLAAKAEESRRKVAQKPRKQKPRKQRTEPFQPSFEAAQESEKESPPTPEEKAPEESPRALEEPPVPAPSVKSAELLLARVRAIDVESVMSRPFERIAFRVCSWRKSFFRSSEGEGTLAPQMKDSFLEQRDRHAYPYEITNLICEHGVREIWEAFGCAQTNESFFCIGQMIRYRRNLPPLFGVFSDAFSSKKPRTLYHHDILDRTQEELMSRYTRQGTFFKSQNEGLFQQKLFERVCETGSFFAAMENVPSEPSSNGRFFTQVGDMTMRVDDRQYGNIYMLALKVFPGKKA